METMNVKKPADSFEVTQHVDLFFQCTSTQRPVEVMLHGPLHAFLHPAISAHLKRCVVGSAERYAAKDIDTDGCSLAVKMWIDDDVDGGSDSVAWLVPKRP